MPGRQSPPPPDVDKFEEAVRAFRRLVPMTEDEYDALVAFEKNQAFTVAGVSEARIVQEVYDAIDKAIETGTTLDEFKDDVSTDLFDSWGAEDSPRVETIFRSNVMRSYNEGRAEIFDHPAVREQRPYKRFEAVTDSRSCDICDPLDGTVLPADDTFWATHQPPLHPNCRCLHVALTPEEAHDEGVDDEPPEHDPPAEGFGLSADYDPDLSAFHPDVARVLRGLLDR